MQLIGHQLISMFAVRFEQVFTQHDAVADGKHRIGAIYSKEHNIRLSLIHICANIVSAYKPFYERLLPLIPNMPLQIVYPKKFQDNKTEVIGFGLKPTSARKELNGLYLYGIKQCISHLIGIANGPAVGDFSEWDRNIKGKTLRFGTILYKFNLSLIHISNLL